MNKSLVLNIVLAMAVAFLAWHQVAGISYVNTPTENAEEAVLENIATRTSIRDYTNKPVEKDKVEKLLRAAMAAPTAMNKQPWHFIVVDRRNVLDALMDANPHAKMLRKAPLAIVVCGDLDKAIEGDGRDFWIQDASAATENLLLAAHAMGLGAVWTGLYPAEERCNAVKKVFALPDNIIPLDIVVIGYPAENPQPKDKFKEDNISYNVYGEGFAVSAKTVSEYDSELAKESKTLGRANIDGFKSFDIMS